DLELLHPTLVHEYQPAFEVKDLDAVTATGDQSALQFFAGTQRFHGGMCVALGVLKICLCFSQLNLSDRLRTQHLQRIALVFAQLPRYVIQHAERAQSMAFRSDQWRSCIEPNVRI